MKFNEAITIVEQSFELGDSNGKPRIGTTQYIDGKSYVKNGFSGSPETRDNLAAVLEYLRKKGIYDKVDKNYDESQMDITFNKGTAIVNFDDNVLETDHTIKIPEETWSKYLPKKKPSKLEAVKEKLLGK